MTTHHANRDCLIVTVSTILTPFAGRLSRVFCCEFYERIIARCHSELCFPSHTGTFTYTNCNTVDCPDGANDGNSNGESDGCTNGGTDYHPDCCTDYESHSTDSPDISTNLCPICCAIGSTNVWSNSSANCVPNA
jgi:hypothetical protein